jgi:hypothetical protein
MALHSTPSRTPCAGAGKASEIEGRIKQLREQIEETTSDYDKESSRSAWPNSSVASRLSKWVRQPKQS